MARKYYKPILNKWELENLIQISSKIIRIEIQNQEINNKLKTVFFCESEKETYKKLGRSDKWIQQRMTGQETRNKLTD